MSAGVLALTWRSSTASEPWDSVPSVHQRFLTSASSLLALAVRKPWGGRGGGVLITHPDGRTLLPASPVTAPRASLIPASLLPAGVGEVLLPVAVF